MAEPQVARPATVLVVDDERLIRWSVRRHLEQAGFRVDVAATGREAVARFGDDIGVVVLDLRLPDADGLELLREIKALRPDCPVIVVTADSATGGSEKALRRGAQCVLGKPFALDDLARRVGEALHSSH